jgi:RimJ/RimL family protein N-acetyltransferase
MELRTARLILRDFVAEDWRAVLAYQQHPDYLRFYPSSERVEEEARGFLEMFLSWQAAEPRHRFQLAIILAETGELIGNAGIRCARPGDREAELGYELSPAHWGYGYATEAAAALLEFGFRELALERVTANCNAENAASARVLEKLGFQLVECQERAIYFKGRWWDTLIYEHRGQDSRAMSCVE